MIDAAPDVAALLTELPDATFIVTSRARLRVRGEQVFDVEPLATSRRPARGLADRGRRRACRPALRRPGARRRPALRAHRGRTPRMSRASAARSTACRSRSSSRRRASGSSRRLRCSRSSTACSPPLGTVRSRPPRASAHDPARRWNGASTCSARSRGRCSCDSVSSRATSASMPSRRSRRRSSGPCDLPGTLLELVDGSLLRQHDVGGEPFFSMLVPVRELAAARFDARCGCRGGAPSARRVLRAARRRDRAAAARNHPAGRGRAAGGGAGQPPRRVPASHRDRRGRHGRRCGVAAAASTGGSATSCPTAKAWTDDLLGTGAPLADRTRAIAITFSSWVSLAHPGHRGRPRAARGGGGPVPRGRRPVRRGGGADGARYRLHHVVGPGSRPG